MRLDTLTTLIALMFAIGCGSDDSSSPKKGSGGASGGKGGTGGTVNSGGTSGSGATGGAAGSPGGGGGGGSGGAAGSGGVAGSGGSSNAIDSTTLDKKIVFGYQGWFLCPGDSSPPNRWVHWFKSQTPTAANLSFEMWPDTTELDADELFATQMTYANGQPAKLYSAYTQKTVVRHFKWMKDTGVDGVMLQRFLSELSDNAFFDFRNHVAENARAGAEANGRVYAMMYDISGASGATLIADLKKDWAYLVDTLKITSSDRYLKHKGKPLLAIWGLGFTDRPGSAAEAAQIIDWFKNQAPANQQVTLMGGVPTSWRTLNNDSKTDPAWANVYTSFDVVSPWSVGRYVDDAGADNFKKNQIAPDLIATQAKGVDYLPVVFPGFSWKNLNAGPLNQIPRKGGSFWWHQVYNAMSAGSTMIYGAMFDEVDEGTAMFKLAPNAAAQPAQGTFLPLDADGQTLPSDWYLKVAGEGSKMLRGQTPLSNTIPITP